MALYKLEEFYPDYREKLFDGDDIKGLDVHAGKTGEKIGSIDGGLVDESGRFRYFVVDTGFWIFGKKVLLPVGYCQIDDRARRIYATGILNKKQVEELPEYNDSTRVNRNYEERVLSVYRTHTAETKAVTTEYMASVDTPVPLEASAPLYAVPTNAISAQASDANYGYDTYNYQQEPSVYDLNDRNHQSLKLYEERLVANKQRRQTGEVIVNKHVETETARVSLPLEKERVVIERTTPADAGMIASTRNIDFREGEVARMKVYEETADIHKEAFVREEVKIRKEVEQDMVEAQETLRREELDIDTKGRRFVDRKIDQH